MVQIEWAPVAAWDLVSKMGTAVAPVARTPLFTTARRRILPWRFP